VASLGEILRRFRFHGVPGAAVAFGVPVDRSSALEAELRPIFMLLETDLQNAAELLGGAELDAARRHSVAIEQRRQLLDDARSATGAARREATAALITNADLERGRLLAGAREEVERIERIAAERTPGLVEEVLRRVLAFGESFS
jgi:hypothetical protein